MPISRTYTTVDGLILAETANGVTKHYTPDSQGSITSVTDNTGNELYSATYWPYGEIRTESGTRPPFSYIGALGYMRDFMQLLYVRARYLRTDLARWLTVDPMWPSESAYGYADDTPIQGVDPSGRWAKLALLLLTACGIIAIKELTLALSRYASKDHMVHCTFYCRMARFTPCGISPFLSELLQLILKGCLEFRPVVGVGPRIAILPWTPCGDLLRKIPVIGPRIPRVAPVVSWRDIRNNIIGVGCSIMICKSCEDCCNTYSLIEGNHPEDVIA
jgi:RHS repeat-associated protein